MSGPDWLSPVALAQASREVDEAKTALTEAQQARRSMIRAALAAGATPTQVSRWAGINRAAVYQIRDEIRDDEKAPGHRQ